MLEISTLSLIEIREICPSQNRKKDNSVRRKLINLAHISTVNSINMEGIRNYIISSQFSLLLLYISPENKQINKENM